MVHHLRSEQFLPITRDEAWAFFSTPRNLDRLTPPHMKFRIVHLDSEEMYEGQRIEYQIRLAPLVWTRWVTRILEVEAGHRFVDEQERGPYRLWRHEHRFEEVDGGVLAHDHVAYEVGMGPLGEIARAVYVKGAVESIFRHRKEVLEGLYGAEVLERVKV